jgi:hypothetical protein
MKCLTICFDKMTFNNHISIIDNDSRVYMIIVVLRTSEVHLLNICYLSYTYIGEALSPETPLLNAIVV